MSGFGPSAVGGTVESGEIADGAITQAKLDAGVNKTFDAYAAGTAYALTSTPAALDFGTTDPSIAITTAGTYRIKARVNLKYNGATFAAVRTITLKLRRTNNTAADLTNSSAVVTTAIITTLTQTLMSLELPEVVYTTANTDDAITIFGSIDVVPSVGSLDVVEASIHAVRVA